MAEPPVSWDQMDDESTSMPLVTTKCSELNVNATEFVSLSASAVSFTPTAAPAPSTSTLPQVITRSETPIITTATTTAANER